MKDEDSYQQAAQLFSVFGMYLGAITKRHFFEYQLGKLKDFASNLLSKGQRCRNKGQLTELVNLISTVSESYKDSAADDQTFFDVFHIGALYGQYIKSVEVEFTKEEVFKFAKAYGIDQTRQRGLRKEDNYNRAAKEWCQDIAVNFWNSPDHKDKKLGAMCKVVREEIRSHMDGCKRTYRNKPEELGFALGIEEAIPGKPEGLKPWLREVAPAFASRGGAPSGPRKAKKQTK